MNRVFLFDVDNTLLDNDAVKGELEQVLEVSLRCEDTDRFWELYEEVRDDLGLVSFPETVERFLPVHCADPMAQQNAARSLFELDFAAHLRPGALKLLERAALEGTPLILSNGDQFFQRWKIWKAGLAAASENRVWVFPERSIISRTWMSASMGIDVVVSSPEGLLDVETHVDITARRHVASR